MWNVWMSYFPTLSTEKSGLNFGKKNLVRICWEDAHWLASRPFFLFSEEEDISAWRSVLKVICFRRRRFLTAVLKWSAFDRKKERKRHCTEKKNCFFLNRTKTKNQWRHPRGGLGGRALAPPIFGISISKSPLPPKWG